VTDAPDGAFALDCAACGHGDSGTGVFNDRDELVGIVTAGYSADANRLLVLSERYPG
jgi:S1-C subfamily serine protease